MLAYLHQPNSEHDAKVDARRRLHCASPRRHACLSSTVDCGTRLCAAKRVRAVVQEIESAAAVGVLHESYRLAVPRREERVPFALEEGFELRGRHDAREQQGGEDDGGDGLQALEDGRSQPRGQVPGRRGVGAGVRGAQQVGVDVGVDEGGDGKDDGEDGEGGGYGQGEVRGVEVDDAERVSRRLD